MTNNETPKNKGYNFISFFLGIIAIAIIVYILRELKTIFLPLTFAVFLSFLFHPLNRFLHKKQIPTVINILIIVTIILFTFTIIGTIIYTSTSSFVTDFPRYETQITNMIKNVVTKSGIPMEDVTNYLNNRVNWLQMAEKISLSKIISGTMGTFIDFLIKLLLTVVFMIFIVLERNKISRRVSAVITEDNVIHTRTVLSKIEKEVKTYIVNKTLISAITALISIIFIALFGIDFVIISGLLIFILNYIPNLGSVVASAFPILICFIQYGISWQLFAISPILIATQMIMGNIVEPRIMGTDLKLSPLFVLISLILWYWIWGPVGMIVAVPITSALNRIIKEIPSMKIFSAFISTE